MNTAEIVDIGGIQAVKLPEGFRFDSGAVSIRREGDAAILEPVKRTMWPEGFFEVYSSPKCSAADLGKPSIASLLGVPPGAQPLTIPLPDPTAES